MVIEKPYGRVVVDERVVDEPVDHAALGAGVAEGVPRAQQMPILLVQLVFETMKGARARNDPLDEVDHVLVPDVRSATTTTAA